MAHTMGMSNLKGPQAVEELFWFKTEIVTRSLLYIKFSVNWELCLIGTRGLKQKCPN